jgi:hypothetical protein
MIKLLDLLKESIQYTNWAKPSVDSLKKEFRIEHELKGHDFFDSEEDFLEAARKAQVVTVTPSQDARIAYRSGTESKEELLDLIKSYRSYPKYRNEKTLENMYNRFETNQSMDMPIVLEFGDGQRRIFAGNTRMDIAFQLGINPKVFLIKAVNS